MVKDPICGMEVDESKTKYKAEKDDRTYYFCSQTLATSSITVVTNASLLRKAKVKPSHKVG